jgi:hypothetical protein
MIALLKLEYYSNQTGQKIGEIRDIFRGKKLEEIIVTADGFLVTLR